MDLFGEIEKKFFFLVIFVNFILINGTKILGIFEVMLVYSSSKVVLSKLSCVMAHLETKSAGACGS